MKKTIRTSVELLPGQYETIQQIASELGYIQKRGVGTGKVGSMAQLMQAIATGEVKVIEAAEVERFNALERGKGK